MARGRDVFTKLKKPLCLLSRFYSLFPMRMRIRFLERARYKKGKMGIGLRYALIKSIAEQCGDNVSIHEGCYLLNPQHLILGNNISIQPMCYLECGKKPHGITIKDDVSIAHGTTIMATQHRYDALDLPIKDQGVEEKPVFIENNVWIGAKATVLAGVTVESGCIIGAGAVVTRDTQADGIYVGVPAVRKKERV